MEQPKISSKALVEYKKLIYARNNRAILLFIKLLVVLFFMGIVWYDREYGIANVTINVSVGEVNYANILFAILLLSLAIRFISLFLNNIPGLRVLQDRMERKELEKIKATYQYQLSVKK